MLNHNFATCSRKQRTCNHAALHVAFKHVAFGRYLKFKFSYLVTYGVTGFACRISQLKDISEHLCYFLYFQNYHFIIYY